METSFSLGRFQGQGLHFALGLFPGELTEGGVGGGLVKVGGQWTLALFFAADGRGGENGGAAVKDDALPPPVQCSHIIAPLEIVWLKLQKV